MGSDAVFIEEFDDVGTVVGRLLKLGLNLSRLFECMSTEAFK